MQRSPHPDYRHGGMTYGGCIESILAGATAVGVGTLELLLINDPFGMPINNDFALNHYSLRLAYMLL